MAARTFYMETLGCPKNRVDAEVIWATASKEGMLAVDDPARADVIIVNTCAFIEPAVQESLDKIIELAACKQAGCCSMLVVAGCLPSRYGKALLEELPEVDLFVGPGEAGRLAALLAESGRRLVCEPGRAYLPEAGTPRVNSLSPGAAYLKVAEGCSRRCTFCIIPRLRGPQKSRPVDDLAREAGQLVELGVREIVLVAQDLIGYGRDLPGRPELCDLLQALVAVPGLRWLRLMYLFPLKMPGRLVRVMADNPGILNYLDLPFQHADPELLARMRRGGDPASFRALVDRLRDDLPGAVLRTSLMTGFPGETEEAFGNLVEFVDHCRFERLGVFAYSPEAGSPAAGYPDRVPPEVAERRREFLMSRQVEIARAYHRSLLGTTLEVLVEEEADEGKQLGRAWNQAPEVDGVTLLSGDARAGEIVKARVVGTSPYDLEAEIIE